MYIMYCMCFINVCLQCMQRNIMCVFHKHVREIWEMWSGIGACSTYSVGSNASMLHRFQHYLCLLTADVVFLTMALRAQSLPCTF